MGGWRSVLRGERDDREGWHAFELSTYTSDQFIEVRKKLVLGRWMIDLVEDISKERDTDIGDGFKTWKSGAAVGYFLTACGLVASYLDEIGARARFLVVFGEVGGWMEREKGAQEGRT